MSDWVFPSEVRGWLTETEGRKLAELARGKRVLEIGSYEGKSTICMAQVATRVDCIDPCDGRATTAPGEHKDALVANIMRYGLKTEVRLYVGTTEEIAPDLDSGDYDLIFIDGNHHVEMVEKDIAHAKRLLAPGGLIAFHDYNSPQDPGVTAAVDNLLFSGAVLEAVAGTVAVVNPKPRDEQKPSVLLTMPRGGRWIAFGASQGFHFEPTMGRCHVAQGDYISSGADRNFNACLAGALNAIQERGASHWALMHADICPDRGFLDIMLGEMARTGAGFVSVVVPIKDMRGLTSTAIKTDDIWNPRRLTLKEIHSLPETFGDEDVGGELLLNTGLSLFDMSHRWVKDVLSGAAEPPCFQTISKIIRLPDGKFRPLNRSEDWEWSRELRDRGVKQVCTRKVRVLHTGEHDFPNDLPWGNWETDRVHAKRTEAKEQLCESTV